MKKRQRSFSIPGISLLLLIFLALCLVTFSLLSLSGSYADETLSRKAADRTAAYYTASNAANETLSEIEGHLAEFLRQAEQDPSPKSTYRKLCEELPALVEGCTFEDGLLVFPTPVSEDQILLAGLKLDYPKDDEDPLYQVVTWKIVNTGEWNPDTRQNVFLPE